MNDFVHLRGELLVHARDHLLDGVEHVRLDEAWSSSACTDQGLDRILDFGRGAFGSRLEALLQQGRETRPLSGLPTCLAELQLVELVSVAMTTRLRLFVSFRFVALAALDARS